MASREDYLSIFLKDASAIYNIAWGNSWPHQHRNRIFKTEIGTASDRGDDADYACTVDLEIPAHLDYVCVKRFLSIADHLITTNQPQTSSEHLFIVRNEYIALREMIEMSPKRAIVVTGHPGIGS